MRLQTISVELGERRYPILVGKNAIAEAGRLAAPLCQGERAVIISVPLVDGLYGAPLRESLAGSGIPSETVLVPDREGAKTLESYTGVVGKLVKMGAGRGAIMIALGGGCVGDLAGFVAATYMRGVKLAHIPTTLLAQVDSSIGGKAALNLPEAKNMLGAFHQPSFVLSDVGTLKTLPRREVMCGAAELVKYAAILDIRFFEFLEEKRAQLMEMDEEATVRAVCRAAELKAGIVAKDEREQSGLRALLNFGHTFGHAIEAGMEYRGLSHGEAIAVGMAGEARLAEALGMLPGDAVGRLEELLAGYGLPTRLGGIDAERIIGLMGHDKKVAAGKIRFALPDGLGRGAVITDPPREAVKSALKGVIRN